MEARKRGKCGGPSCERLAVTAGLCSAHYQQRRRDGRLRQLSALAAAKGDERVNLVVRVDPKQRAVWEREARWLGADSLAAWMRSSLDLVAATSLAARRSSTGSATLRLKAKKGGAK